MILKNHFRCGFCTTWPSFRRHLIWECKHSSPLTKYASHQFPVTNGNTFSSRFHYKKDRMTFLGKGCKETQIKNNTR